MMTSNENARSRLPLLSALSLLVSLQLLSFSPVHAQCVDPPGGMEAWWPLDEAGGGVANDLIGQNDGTWTGGPVPVLGHVDVALEFDGTNDYVLAAGDGSHSLSDLTLDLWIRPDVVNMSSGTNHSFVTYLHSTAPPSSGYHFGIVNGNLAFTHNICSPLSFFVDSGYTPPTSQWTHIAVTVDSAAGQIIIYANGAQVHVNNSYTVTSCPSLSDTAWLLGAGESGLAITPDFDGRMDEVEVFNRALSQPEIQAIHAAGAAGKCKAECTPPPADMVSWYPGDDCLAGDIVGPNDGTQIGSPACAASAKVGPFSLLFGSGTGYVQIPHGSSLNFGTDEFTLDAWVLPSLSTGPILQKGLGDGGVGYLFDLTAGKPRITLCDTFQCPTITANSSVLTGLWHHVTATVQRSGGVDGSGRRQAVISIFVDGQFEGSVAALLEPVDSTEDLLMGASGSVSAPSVIYEGLMDEVEIFSRALSISEVAAIAGAGATGKCRCVDPPSDMVGWWAFDENAGTTARDLAGTQNGSHIGSPTPVSGKVLGALQFDGVDDYVRVPSSPAFSFGTSGDFTIDAWIKFQCSAASISDQVIVDNRSGPGFGGYLFSVFPANCSVNPPDLWLHLRMGSDFFANAASIEEDVWTHVAVTVERSGGGLITYYIDGEAFDFDTPVASDASSTGDLIIGHLFDPALGGKFGGLIDELEIFERALSPAEVKSIYDARSGGKCKPAPIPEFATLDPAAVPTLSEVALVILGLLLAGAGIWVIRTRAQNAGSP